MRHGRPLLILMVVVLLALSAVISFADRIVQSDNFDDGNLTAGPKWEYAQPGSVTVSGERATSGAYSLKVSSANELGAVRTCSGVRSADQPFTSTFNLYVESMGDEAIPWSVQNAYTGGIAAIIFILPGGTVQLFVMDSTSGFSGKSASVPYPLTYGAWHSFRITYEGSTTNLYLDGHTAPDASVAQPYVRDPSFVCIGNFSNPHTSTFYIDDLVFSRPGGASPAPVYIQVCSDTSTGGIDVSRRYIDFPELDNTYTTPEGQAARVMSESYRNAHRDSLGNPIKFTWYMQTGSLYAAGIDSGPLLPYELMEDYHGDAIRRWGDEMAYHYHTWIWSDPNGDGTYYWNQASDFSYCMEDFDRTTAQMLLDRGFYPSSFRSGWHYMDNLWQRHLDDWFPYRFENDWPAYRTETEEPTDNIYDWRRAPSTWAPYHPDPDDYQSPGTLRGWDSRSKYIDGATTAVLSDAFYKALDGEPQLMTLFSHLKEDFPEQVDALHQRLIQLHESLPAVEFEYLTGRECMLKWRNGTDVTPPNLQITTEDTGGIRTAVLAIDEDIYQIQPFVALLDAAGDYRRLDCTPIGPRRWSVSYDAANTRRIAVGVTDWFGNPRVQFLCTPLRLTNFAASDVTSTTADLRWETSNPADTRAEYEDLSIRPGISTVSDGERRLVHRVKLVGLSPGHVYRVRCAAEDEFGQRAESAGIYVVTKMADPVIVDNLDAGFSTEGTWSTGSTTPGAYGPDYRWIGASPTGTLRATWTWQVPRSDIYRIQARWSAGANRTTTARYSVSAGESAYVRVVDQQIDGGKWNTLHTSALAAEDTVTVRLSNTAPSGFVVIADSVRFEPAFVPVPSIGLARLLGDGESILVSGAVTAVFGSEFYVEALDRSSAIRVRGTGVSIGEVVEVGGLLGTSDGERVLASEYIRKTGETRHLRPVGLLGKYVDSRPDMSGMLVRVWGKVRSTGDGYFHIDSGSTRPDASGSIGLRIDASLVPSPPTTANYAVVTGIAGTESVDARNIRIIRPATADDVVLY